MRTADIALIERAARRGGTITAADVAAVGLTESQWSRRRDAEWIAMTPASWRHLAATATWEREAADGLAWLGRRGALYGPSAAALWGLDGFLRTCPVHFVVPRVRRAVTPHRILHTTRCWTGADLLTREGLRTTSATRTIIDLAGMHLSAAELERAIDSAMRLRLTSLPTLRRRLAVVGGQGRHGTLLLRELLLDSGGESHLERRFLRLIRVNGLPRPRCQVVHRRNGRTVARVDFEFIGARLIVEVSGRLGHRSDEDRRRDARRRNQLQSERFVVLEFTTADVIDDDDYVIGSLREHLAR